jgi:hypothetical protein
VGSRFIFGKVLRIALAKHNTASSIVMSPVSFFSIYKTVKGNEVHLGSPVSENKQCR